MTVDPGHTTRIQVSATKTSSYPELLDVDVDKRGCRFSKENDNMKIMTNYTEAGCRFECLLQLARDECGCSPWNYPHPHGNA